MQLLDNKWEPYTFIETKQVNIEQMKKTISDLEHQIKKCESEIDRARAFLADREVRIAKLDKL